MDFNCTFPKSALLNLGNGKYSTIRIEYPWVPPYCAYCKIFGHSHLKCQAVKEVNDSAKSACPDHVEGSDVDADDSSPVRGTVNLDADNHITTPNMAGNVKVDAIQTGNTFECLAICEEAGNLEVAIDPTITDVSDTTIQKVAVDTIAIATDTTTPNVISTLSGGGSLESPKLDLANIAEFSDTSPVCETFKQVKRIDELDYLPLSKKKLKKLRKQEHATKSANSSSRVDTISPYIVGID